MRSEKGWDRMHRILVANIFGIGDVLFTTPLIEGIKKAMPDSEIGYLCNRRTRPLLEGNPHIDYVHVYEKDDFAEMYRDSRSRFIRGLYGFFRDIKMKRYNTVFDMTLSREFGLLYVLAGIGLRIGLDYKKRGLFLNRKVPLRCFRNAHVSEYYLKMGEQIGVLSPGKKLYLYPDSASVARMEEYLKVKDIMKRPVVALIPGGGASWGKQAGRKQWTVEGFSKTADSLVDKGAEIIILGGPGDREACEKTARGINSRVKAVENDLSLKDFIALVSKCDLVVCNDGGPLHIATALGVRTVSIFGPVDDECYGPYGNPSDHRVIKLEDISCRPCYNRFRLPECKNDGICLTGIDHKKVLSACLELLLF